MPARHPGPVTAMGEQVIEFARDDRRVRRARELRTIEAMMRMYCRAHHERSETPICLACQPLLDYAKRRLDRCVFGDAKPTCANCTVHCYSADMREGVRTVMRWAGPRMLLRHPVLAVVHKLDGRRPAPALPAKGSRKALAAHASPAND